jgi:hypothetical protein
MGLRNITGRVKPGFGLVFGLGRRGRRHAGLSREFAGAVESGRVFFTGPGSAPGKAIPHHPLNTVGIQGVVGKCLSLHWYFAILHRCSGHAGQRKLGGFCEVARHRVGRHARCLGATSPKPCWTHSLTRGGYGFSVIRFGPIWSVCELSEQ